MAGKKREGMTDEERMEDLEKREQKIRAEKAALRKRMEAKKHKEFYDACKRNKIELKGLDEVPFFGLFAAVCSRIPISDGNGNPMTVFEYVIGHEIFRDMAAKTGVEIPKADGAPGRAQ